jgi:hypothetical protein
MNKRWLYGDLSIDCFILYRFIYISLDTLLWLNFDKIKCLCRLPARSPLRPPRTQAWGKPDSHVLFKCEPRLLKWTTLDLFELTVSQDIFMSAANWNRIDID